jgi:hypothetical protein
MPEVINRSAMSTTLHLDLDGVPTITTICTCVGAGLPKTRSGKIMRRILRKIADHKDDDLG